MFGRNLMPQSSEWKTPSTTDSSAVFPGIKYLLGSSHIAVYGQTHTSLCTSCLLSGVVDGADCRACSGSARRSYLTVQAEDSSVRLPPPPYSSRKTTQFNTNWKVWQCPKCETWSSNGGIVNAGAISQNYMSSHSRKMSKNNGEICCSSTLSSTDYEALLWFGNQQPITVGVCGKRFSETYSFPLIDSRKQSLPNSQSTQCRHIFQISERIFGCVVDIMTTARRNFYIDCCWNRWWMFVLVG